MKNKIVACCFECGKKKYNTQVDLYGVTMAKGGCPFCKKEKWLIPACDWECVVAGIAPLD